MNKYILESSVYQLFKAYNDNLDSIRRSDVSDDISMIAFATNSKKGYVLKYNGTEYNSVFTFEGHSVSISSDGMILAYSYSLF